MSDYGEDSFDSFDSGSESESESAAFSTASAGSERPPPAPAADRRVKELSSSHGRKSYLSHSDQEEQEGSASLTSSANWMKIERSPKPPKRRFRANISNFKQKIKSKLRKDVAVFGTSLEMATQRSQLGTDGVELPTVFRECIDYLEERGLAHEGIYRLPGVKSRIEDLRTRYDKGEIVDLSDSDPNVVASLLKLYLRELPESLIPSRLIGRFEAVTASPQEEQLAAIEELMEEVPAPCRLLLGWLLVHMDHIIEHSSVNKMTLPNMVIVFSPTLQIPPTVLHLLYRHSHTLLSDIELKKYERPVMSTSRKDSSVIDLSYVYDLETEEEISTELQKLTGTLEKLHGKVAGKFDERDDYCWELQRAVTELRRKLKAVKKSTHPSQTGEDDEFLKTLMLMEATLTAENEELLAKKEALQASIREEVETIEQMKKELQQYPPRSSTEAVVGSEELEDEAELAKKVAALRWHGKELEMLSFQHGPYVSDSVDGLEAVLINVHVHRHFRSMNQCCAKKQEPNTKHSRRRAANTAAQGNTESTATQAKTEYGRVAS